MEVDFNSLLFETKCRRCGTLTEWVYGSLKGTSYVDFLTDMVHLVKNPKQYRCVECCTYTVQDVVKHTMNKDYIDFLEEFKPKNN